MLFSLKAKINESGNHMFKTTDRITEAVQPYCILLNFVKIFCQRHLAYYVKLLLPKGS